MHPDEHDLILYIENRLGEGERKTVEAHIARCEDCAHRFAHIFRLPSILEGTAPVEVDEPTLRDAEGIVRPDRSARASRSTRPLPKLRWAFAFAGLIAIAITTYLLVPRPEDPAQFRSEETEELPGLRLHPPDGATITMANPQFHWSALKESAAYRFSLMENTGVTLWTNDLQDTVQTLPPFIVLQSGKTYLWRVETFLADKNLRRSALHAFTYTPSE
jgi:hypothetical protein